MDKDLNNFEKIFLRNVLMSSLVDEKRVKLFCCLTLAHFWMPAKSFPKEELLVCLPVLYGCLEDRNADVRKAAGEVVYGFMVHLGFEAMQKQTEKLKPGSKSVVLAALDKARQNLPIQPLPPSKPAKGDPKSVKTGGAQKSQGAQKVGQIQGANKGKTITKPSSASSNRSKKEEEEGIVPLLPRNNSKNQRIIDDQKLKVLKWNFTMPREEFYDLLKDQMTSAGVAKPLIANMFHADFRYHIKSIESLMEDLPDNGPALISNLDLILKWMTLRFFDTNPSVLLKGLEYLTAVFQYLIDEGYNMAEYEASCFIPYLIMKIGDPKDAVRNGVRLLFKQICTVYPPNKLFVFMMDGLKSKNARQRSECLECIGNLVDGYGMSVMGSGGPSTTAAIREIAKHIGDRDNAVRSAALNAVVNTYFLEGEKIYKMIGQISDKDLSLLEERIKRAAKTRTVGKTIAPAPLATVGKSQSVQQIEVEKSPPNQITVDTIPGVNIESDEEDEGPQIESPPTRIPMQLSQEKYPMPPIYPSGIGLDHDLLARLDAQKVIYPALQLKEIDISYLDEPVALPPRPPPSLSSRASMHPMAIPPRIPTMSSLANNPVMSPMGTGIPFGSRVTPPAEDNILTEIIQNLGSSNWALAENAKAHLDGLFHSGNGTLVLAYEEQILQSIVKQLVHLKVSAMPQSELYNAYKCLLYIPNMMYENRSGGRTVSTQTLQMLISELLMLLGANNAPPGGPAGESVGHLVMDDKMVKVVNHLCARIIDHSERTNLLCALLSLLHNSVGGVPKSARFRDLVLKCTWKTMKMLLNWDANTIDYDRLLAQLHLFMKAYPSSYWKQNPTVGDTPCRTVKTLLHSCMKKKGPSLMNHLSHIPDWQNSELHSYMQKLSKYLKMDENNENDEQITRAINAEMTRIMKKIVDKENSKEGLNQLYDLKENHPSIDIWEHMKGTSIFFRSYIERGLSQIAEQRRYGMRPVYSTADNVASHINTVFEDSNMNDLDSEIDKDAAYYMNRLKLLQANAGLTSTPYSQSNIDNRTYDVLSSIASQQSTIMSTTGNDTNLNDLEITSDEKDPVVYLKRLKVLQANAGINITDRLLPDHGADNPGRLGLDPKFDTEVPSLLQKDDSLDALKLQLQKIKNSKK